MKSKRGLCDIYGTTLEDEEDEDEGGKRSSPYPLGGVLR